ncbi:MAG: oligosaccharide flippase family protein [Candidatus Marinimicrobia bacterium]|nr:oligosaccharide flippase family protein [Candidatus Neomarinimicrobiota bacterium]
MLKNISSTLLVMVISMLSSLAVTIILGRTLSISDFGEFALLKQILLIGFTVAIFGLDYGYIKFFSNSHSSNRKIHIITIIIVVFIALLFVLLIKLLYNFQLYKLFFIFFSICFGSINLYQAALYRLKNKYLLGQLFTSGWKIILIILISSTLLFGLVYHIKFVYMTITISLFVFSSFIIRYIYKDNNIQYKNVDYKNYLKLGFIFWLINSTGLISGGLDKIAIPLMFNEEVLGIFTGVSFIFVISLTMIGSAIGYVIFPQISSGKNIQIWKINLLVLSITITAVIIFSLYGKYLVNIIFSGKFDDYISSKLIFYFTVIGSLQIVHTILHFILSAQANRKQLFIYLIMTIFFIVFFILLLVIYKYFSFSILIYISVIIIITRILKISSMIILLKMIKNDQTGYLRNIPEAI